MGFTHPQGQAYDRPSGSNPGFDPLFLPDAYPDMFFLAGVDKGIV
jgi:hypothetical protein